MQVMRAFVDQHRDQYGVEPICKVLRIAPSGYRRHAAQGRNLDLRYQRAKRDEILMTEIRRVWEANLKVYGADKVWHQLTREGIAVARCTVERLMRRMGIQGVRRGTTVDTDQAPRLPKSYTYQRKVDYYDLMLAIIYVCISICFI